MPFTYCKKCVEPNTRPNSFFNEDGVCPACLYAESLAQVDWDERMEVLKKLSRDLKPPVEGEYDCIMGVSGGKDSLRQALFVKHTLGLRPLLVCLGYPPEQVTQRGVDNVSLMIEHGFDCILIQPSPATWKPLVRKAFLQHANWCKSTEYPLFASVPRVAIAYQIQLVFWGENPGLQIGDTKTLREEGWDGNALRNMNTLQGGSPDWLMGGGITQQQALQYFYPPAKEMERAGIQIVYLGYFWKDWSMLDNGLYSVVNGLTSRVEAPEDTGDIYGVSSLDEDWVGMNQMIKYLKFGFGRANEYVSQEIRKGNMTREEGFKIVEQYDGNCSDEYIESFCEFIDISKEQFWETVDQFVNKDLFKKDESGKWVRTFKVGD
ncbi:MAG: N-acetyl sugar amidotransferase [Verrucomicrobiota bacterium]